MRILLLDIETAPNTVHVWGLYDQNVAINQIISTGYVMCWSAKWHNERKIFFDSIKKSKHKEMLNKVHSLMDEADAIIHYNGKKFDIPTLQKEFILHGLKPPAPYKQIDLLDTARHQFRFVSNKLDFVAQQLKLGNKIPHTGHQLWIDCMANKPEAWNLMERYNKHDVVLLERVYNRLLPWIQNHPNRNVFDGTKGCPNCGKKHFQPRGFSFTSTKKYQRYLCRDCGTWFRSDKPEKRILSDNSS